MKIAIRKSIITAVALMVLVSAPTMAMGGDRGTILTVHDKAATEKFKAARGLPSGQQDGGRFAVVKIEDGAYGDASFALVYVPPQFTVHEDSVVELDASGVDVLAHPGSAAVSRVISKEPSSLIKAIRLVSA